jgi:hypothetical protein
MAEKKRKATGTGKLPLSVYLPPDMDHEIREMAEKEWRSLNDQVGYLLHIALETLKERKEGKH